MKIGHFDLSLQKARDLNPVFSVIIPTHNNAEYIEAAIASVQAQEIGNKKLEIIVVDDASTDATSGILSRLQKEMPNLHVIRHEKNLGVSAARNNGIAHARGDFLAFLDGDDIWDPSKLEAQFFFTVRDASWIIGRLHDRFVTAKSDSNDSLEVATQIYDEFKTGHGLSIIERAKVRLLLGKIFSLSYYDNLHADGRVTINDIFIDGKDEEGFWKSKHYTEDQLLRGAIEWKLWFGTGSTLFAHQDAIRKNGLFNEKLGFGEDTEYVMRHILNGGYLDVAPLPLMQYRLPAGGKQYRGKDFHYEYMADTYRCRIAQKFGAETAANFIESLRIAQKSRTAPGETWRGAMHELTILPDAPCTRKFDCGLKYTTCHRPKQIVPVIKSTIDAKTA